MTDITPTALLVDVGAPAVSTGSGSRRLAPTANRFSVVVPSVSLIVGQPGQSVADLVASISGVVTQTTFEVVCVGALGLPDVTIPSTNLDLVKRRYETTRPIFGYAPNGTFPIQPDTGVYLSTDLGAQWQALDLPDFPLSTDIAQPIYATRGGRLYLWFGDFSGAVARYDTQSRQMVVATFAGNAGDLALPRAALGLAVEPGASQVLLLAGGPRSGIWRSTDNSNTFALSNVGQSSSTGGSAVAFHPVEAGLCYAGGFATGPEGGASNTGAPLYKSTDSGVTWVLVHTRPVADGHILKIALGDDADIVYLRTQQSILKSADQGSTFSAIHTGLDTPFSEINALAVAPSDEAQLWTAIGIPGPVPPATKIYQSTDAGANWSLKNTLVPLRSGPILTGGIAIHPTDPDRVVFAASGQLSGVYLTSDGGATWTVADEHQGLSDSTILPLWGVAYGPTTQIAATGRHFPTNGGQRQKIKIGEEVIFGEIHDATVTIPFAQAFVEAIQNRTDDSGDTPIFPLLRINKIDCYQTGAVKKTRLVEVRIDRVDGRRGTGGGQITVGGTLKHEDIARGPQAARIVPLSALESIEDSTAEFSATMPGIQTEWQAYDTVTVNSKTIKIAAIRYSITTERRLTVLGFSVTNTAALDRSINTAGDHPRVKIGRPPTVLRRGIGGRGIG